MHVELSGSSEFGGLQSLAEIGQSALPPFLACELQDRQRDADLARVIFMLVGKDGLPGVSGHRRTGAHKLLKQWEKLSFKEILFRVSKDLATGKRFQYVAPQSLRSDVLRCCHEDAGHQGPLRTMHLVKWVLLGKHGA